MNFHATLQRVLAKFEEEFGFKCDCGGKNQYEGDDRHYHYCRAEMKNRLPEIITESLKEAFAAIEVEKMPEVAGDDSDPTDQAREYFGFNAALQAIEEKKAEYFNKQ